MLFDLGKTRLDDLAATLPLCLRGRFLQTGAHGLHLLLMRPDFNLPAFGVARTVLAYRTVVVMATKAFHALTIFCGAPFVIQLPALRTR